MHIVQHVASTYGKVFSYNLVQENETHRDCLGVSVTKDDINNILNELTSISFTDMINHENDSRFHGEYNLYYVLVEGKNESFYCFPNVPFTRVNKNELGPVAKLKLTCYCDIFVSLINNIDIQANISALSTATKELSELESRYGIPLVQNGKHFLIDAYQYKIFKLLESKFHPNGLDQNKMYLNMLYQIKESSSRSNNGS